MDDTNLIREIEEKLEHFVITFVQKFEERLEEFKTLAAVESKSNQNPTDAAISAVDAITSDVSLTGILLFPIKLLTRGYNFFKKRHHERNAKKFPEIYKETDQFRKILIEAAVTTFMSFECQFFQITDRHGNWHRGLEKLAIDAMNRSCNYIAKNNLEVITVDNITKGIIYGKSKTNKQKYGYTVQHDNETWITSKIFEDINLVKISENGFPETYYRRRKPSFAKNYGYRLLFSWELFEKKSNHKLFINRSKIEYVYRLKQTDINTYTNNILKNPKLNTMADNLKEIIQMLKKNNKDTSCLFRLIAPIKSFTGRNSELNDIQVGLQNKTNNSSSQIVSIVGLGGVGKTELARKYANDHIEYYDENILWINAEKLENLTESFHSLSKELKISIFEENDKKSTDGNENTKSLSAIVNEIYRYYKNKKCLFIFDNVEEYSDVIDYLPKYLQSNETKPHVLITSRNQNWKADEERRIIKLTDFEPEDAKNYMKTNLDANEETPENDIVKVSEILHRFPLALKQATAFINERNKKLEKRGEHYSIADYIKDYEETSKINLLNYFPDEESKRYCQTIYTTWNITLSNLENHPKIGKLAVEIIRIMAFVSAECIIVDKFLDKLIEDKDVLWEALELLEKYSLIDINKGTAKIHRLLQDVLRLQLRQLNTDVISLEKILGLFSDGNLLSSDFSVHISTVWTHVSQHASLIEKYVFDQTYDIMESGINTLTPLHLMALSGNWKEIQAVFEKTENVSKIKDLLSKTDSFERTMLHCAAKRGHYNVVELILENGGDLLTRDADDKGVIHYAAESGNVKLMKLLKSKGCDLNDKDDLEQTPLHYAAINGNLNVVEYLKGNEANIFAHDQFGKTAMHFAVMGGNLQVLEFLIDSGSEVNVIDASNKTPLHYAAEIGNFEISNYLIDKNANISAQTNDGNTPLHYASRAGNIQLIKLLLDKGTNINIENQFKITPIHLAAENGDCCTVDFLIKNHADIKSKDKSGKTTIHYAAESGNNNLIELLLLRNCNINTPDDYKQTPLHYAVEEGDENAAKFLIEKGADVFSKTKLGKTIMHCAAECRSVTIVALLKNKGCDVNVTDVFNQTPLHHAAEEGALDVVKYLLKNGANPFAVDKDGRTVLECAEEGGNDEIIKLLEELYSNKSSDKK